MSDLKSKWKCQLDEIQCHPDMQEKLAGELEKIFRDSDFSCKTFDIKAFGKKFKAILRPYDRRDNTLRQPNGKATSCNLVNSRFDSEAELMNFWDWADKSFDVAMICLICGGFIAAVIVKYGKDMKF